MGCCGSTKKKKGKETPWTKSSDSIALNYKNHPELSDTVINNLLNKTKFTRQDIIDWWHGFLVDCPSGLLEKRKFIEVYQYRYPDGKAKKFCNHVFRTFNPDEKTHAIDFERFMSAIDITLNGNSDEKLEWTFTMYDINGDERISKDEMINVVESMYDLASKDKKSNIHSRKRVDQIFSRIDLNRDNYITKEEFILGCKADEEIRTILAPHF